MVGKGLEGMKQCKHLEGEEFEISTFRRCPELICERAPKCILTF